MWGFPVHLWHFLFVDSCSDFGTGKTWHVFPLSLRSNRGKTCQVFPVPKSEHKSTKKKIVQFDRVCRRGHQDKKSCFIFTAAATERKFSSESFPFTIFRNPPTTMDESAQTARNLPLTTSRYSDCLPCFQRRPQSLRKCKKVGGYL